LRKGVKKQQHLSTTFKKLHKHLHRTAFGAVQVSVDKGCIILTSDEPVKPLRGSPTYVWSYLFGTSLLSFNVEGGNGIGFFAPQGMLVKS